MIENRQKTPSGPQGVLLGVPKDPQTTQMAIQDAKMWLPKLTNIKLWCQKGGKPESRRVKDWGPAAEGEALKIYRSCRALDSSEWIVFVVDVISGHLCNA